MREPRKPRVDPSILGAISGLLHLALCLALPATAHCFCVQSGSSATNWVQLGEKIPSDINAPASLSRDGSLVYVGAREYTWSQSRWELRRGDVEGESYGSSGGYYDQWSGQYYGGSTTSSCMSSDNSHFAFGADNKVRVYVWTSDAWTRQGQELVGAHGFGSSVSLSHDGTRLAVGSPSHPSENCTEGAVRVFEWKGGSNSWKQMGEPMFCYNKTDDLVGQSVSLSGDGSRVAIGAPGFDGPDRCDDWYGCWSTKPNMGRVRVYEWDSLGGTWLMLALATYSGNVDGDIDGGSNERFGTSVALSEDGDRLIVGNHKVSGQSKVSAYHWMEPMTRTDWSGNAMLVGDAWIRVGWCDFTVGGNVAASVSMSADGTFIAVSSSGYQSSTVSGVITLRWERGEWSGDGPDGWYMPSYSGKFTFFGMSMEMGMADEGLSDPSCSQSSCYTSFGSSFAIAGDGMSTRVAVQASTGVYVFHVTYCDTTSPPDNGSNGDCPSTIAPEQTCQTNCSDGFSSTGPSECNAQGQLLPGMCLVTSTFQNGTGFGSSVVVSDDGNTVAVLNAPGPGHVRVYGYSQDSHEWTQVGHDVLSNDQDGHIYGTDYMYMYSASDPYPQSVSLSSDGTRLAVGYPGSRGSPGRARVFQRNLNSWTQLGEDIVGGQGNSSAGSWCDDYMMGGDCSWWYREYMLGLGYSVSLSADGSRLAVGSVGTRYSTYVRYSNGNGGYNRDTTLRQVRVYQAPDSATGQWSRLGNTLDAAAGGSMSPSNSYDFEYGSSVSLSNDGSTLAISGWKGLNATVHRFDADQNMWLQLGNGIRLKERWDYNWYDTYDTSSQIVVGDPIGPSIALSGDSKRVIVSQYTYISRNAAPGFVGVYELHHDTGNWTLMGDYIEGVSELFGSRFGHSIAISTDGARIAIGDPRATSLNANYNGDDKGATRVYDWDSWSRSWRPAIGSMYGSTSLSGGSVSLSGDGTRLVVGESQLVTIRHLPADLKAPEAEDNGSTQPDGNEHGNDRDESNLPQVPPSESGSAGESEQPNHEIEGGDERRRNSEETRDAILDDINDVNLKEKAKLLANAAIAGDKVKKLQARLTAVDVDTACSTVFNLAGMSSSDGTCVASEATSRKRRRLSSMAYDVELLFLSTTVSDDALIAAAQELTDNGVEGVSYEASVDPIAELKTIPGVDMRKVEKLEAQTSAAAAQAESHQTVPPPPSPPAPNLVLDDYDCAVSFRALISALVATSLTLVMLLS